MITCTTSYTDSSRRNHLLHKRYAKILSPVNANGKQKQFLVREFQVSLSSSKNIPSTLPPQDHHLIEKWLQDKAEINERVAQFRFVNGTE